MAITDALRAPEGGVRDLTRYGTLSASRWTKGNDAEIVNVETVPTVIDPDPKGFLRPQPGTSKGLFLIHPKAGTVDGYTVQVYRLCVAFAPGDQAGRVVDVRAVLAKSVVSATEAPTLVEVDHYGDLLLCVVTAITPTAPATLPLPDADALVRLHRWA